MTTVVHCKREPFDVYIGRPSKWGNQFVIGRDGTRLDVVWKHAHWMAQPEQRSLFFATREELAGKRLGCYCAPKLCHGHVYAAIADGRACITQGSDGIYNMYLPFSMCSYCEAYIPAGFSSTTQAEDGMLRVVCTNCSLRVTKP